MQAVLSRGCKLCVPSSANAFRPMRSRRRALNPPSVTSLDQAFVTRPRPVMRIARMGMARIRRLMLHAPQSLFLRELVTQPGAVGAICASSRDSPRRRSPTT